MKHRRLLSSRARLGNAHTHRPQPREHFARGLETVANHRRASVLDPVAGKAREKFLKFGLHGLGHEALRTVTKHRAQHILSLRWSAKFNYRILLHGWRDSLCGLLKTIFDNRIPAGHAAFLNSSSYTRFGYTSSVGRLSVEPAKGRRPTNAITTRQAAPRS